MKEKKIAYNISRKTIHRINGCHISKNIKENDSRFELFNNEDEVYKKYQKYFRHCMLCYKEK